MERIVEGRKRKVANVGLETDKNFQRVRRSRQHAPPRPLRAALSGPSIGLLRISFLARDGNFRPLRSPAHPCQHGQLTWLCCRANQVLVASLPGLETHPVAGGSHQSAALTWPEWVEWMGRERPRALNQLGAQGHKLFK